VALNRSCIRRYIYSYESSCRTGKPAGDRQPPIKLVADACQVTGLGITETLVTGLERVKRSAAAAKARALKGKLHLTIDIETSRERARH